MMRYSEELRGQVISRVLAGSGNQEVLAEEFGIGRSTIQNWMREYRASGAGVVMAGEEKREKRPRDWTREERLEALLATHGLSEETLGAWCRERGLHTHHLVQWRRDLVEGPAQEKKSAAEARALREENRALKKELRRKERALAETAALLTLKKKAASIWGDREDD